MKITLAKTAGFCFGVNNAVKMAEDAAQKYGENAKIWTLGPLIHNELVIDKLQEKGIFVLSEEERDKINPGDVVIIRAHGTTLDIQNELTESGATVLDATCPFVKKIHKRVAERYAAGKQIIIIGDKTHPEVIGINSRCDGNAIIVGSLEDCENFDWQQKDYSCVVQTTFNQKKYEKICEFLKIRLDLIEFYDSICNATSCRQEEARELASDSELMVVIGSKNSSNTNRLYEICKEECENVVLVSEPGDIEAQKASNFLKVGVTAGASTPDWLIEEVLFIMDEVNSIVKTDEAIEKAQENDFAEMFEQSYAPIRSGEVIEGQISSIEEKRVRVAISGSKYDGWFKVSELKKDENGNPAEQVGDMVRAYVVYVNEKDCEVQLSKEHEDKYKDLKTVEDAFNAGTPLNLQIIKAVEHGVIAKYGTVNVYISAGQLDLKFVKNLEKRVGQEVEAKITEFKKEGPKIRIKASARVLLEAEKAARDADFWGKTVEGGRYTGIVKSMTKYGAFIELAPGYEGLLHVTEMGWKTVRDPKEVLSVGEEVEVIVKEIVREHYEDVVEEAQEEAQEAPAEEAQEEAQEAAEATEEASEEKPAKRARRPRRKLIPDRISLTLKKPEDDPWLIIKERYPEGTIVDATVEKIVEKRNPDGKKSEIGVILGIEPGITGFVHISQIASKHIDKASDCISIGQELQAKVSKLDEERKKITLSIKEVQAYNPMPKAEELDEDGNPKTFEKPQRKFENADGEPKQRKPRNAKKSEEEVIKDTNITSSTTTLEDQLKDLGFDFSDEQ